MAAAPWPLLERDDEVEALRRAVAVGVGAVVVGPAGVGKTRLVDEVLRTSRRRIETVVTAEAAASIPLGAFAHVLGGSGRRPALHDLIGQAARILEDRVGDGVLFVDDAHHLDPASLTLVGQLVTRAGMTVVATVRYPPEVAPELVALWKDGGLERLAIDALGRDATASLTRAVLGDVDPGVLDRLWALSRGNVLFLRELVLAALERRDRGPSPDRISLAALDDPGERLREMVGARLARVDSEVRNALAVVAASEPLPLSVADVVIDADLLADLEAKGLVRIDGDPRPLVRTGHPIYGEVLRADASVVQRRSVLRRLVRAAADHSVDVDALVLATWQLESGEDADGELLAEGAWAAFSRFDYRLCERLARRGVERGNRESALALAETMMAQADPDGADAALDGWTPASDEERARHAIARAHNLFRQRRRADDAMGVLERAELDLARRPDLRCECQGHRAQVLFLSGRFPEAMALADTILADGASGPVAALRAGLIAGPAWAALGRVDDALAAMDGWVQTSVAEPTAVPMSEPLLRTMRFHALVWSGRAYDAEAYAADDLGLDVEDPPAGMRAILLAVRGRAALARGRVNRAADFLRQADEAGRDADLFGLRPWILAFKARANALVGRLAIANEAVEDAEAAARRLGLASVNAVLARADIALSRAWIAAAEGARSEAVEQARAVADDARRTTRPVALDALHAAARLGAAAEVLPDLERVAARVQGPYALVAVRHARAAAAGDPNALVEVAGQFERLGLDLMALEVYATAAERYREVGRQGSALECGRRAAGLQAACDVPPPPAISTLAGEGVDRLTDREREVALLAAHGHTAPEIAERLFISARTVHTHLQRAYRKLGVHDREALAARFEVRR